MNKLSRHQSSFCTIFLKVFDGRTPQAHLLKPIYSILPNAEGLTQEQAFYLQAAEGSAPSACLPQRCAGLDF